MRPLWTDGDGADRANNGFLRHPPLRDLGFSRSINSLSTASVSARLLPFVNNDAGSRITGLPKSQSSKVIIGPRFGVCRAPPAFVKASREQPTTGSAATFDDSRIERKAKEQRHPAKPLTSNYPPEEASDSSIRRGGKGDGPPEPDMRRLE